MTKSKPRAGASGLGLGHLGQPNPEPGPKPPPRDTHLSRSRGKEGEREVVRLFHRHGWPNALRTPGSGSWRPYGAQDSSPFPMDVASGWHENHPWHISDKGPGPWMVEVKVDNGAFTQTPKSGKGWVGEAFIRRVARKAAAQHAQVHQRIDDAYPAIFAKVSRGPWRVYVPDWVFERAYFGEFGRFEGENWVEVDVGMFFIDIAPVVPLYPYAM